MHVTPGGQFVHYTNLFFLLPLVELLKYQRMKVIHTGFIKKDGVE